MPTFLSTRHFSRDIRGWCLISLSLASQGHELKASLETIVSCVSNNKAEILGCSVMASLLHSSISGLRSRLVTCSQDTAPVTNPRHRYHSLHEVSRHERRTGSKALHGRRCTSYSLYLSYTPPPDLGTFSNTSRSAHFL